MDAAPARVAVTGAAGFIGAALCRRLAADGHRVLGVSVDADGAACIEATGVEARRADITDPSATVAALAGSELVVHAAAKVSEWGRWRRFTGSTSRGRATCSTPLRARLRAVDAAPARIDARQPLPAAGAG